MLLGPTVVDAFAMVSVVAVLILGANAFGIRATQGRSYASAFEATQPYGTGQLAVVKVLVRSVCVLAALTAVAVSVWASVSLIAVGEVFGDPLRRASMLIEGAVGALTLISRSRWRSSRPSGSPCGWRRGPRSGRSGHAIPAA